MEWKGMGWYCVEVKEQGCQVKDFCYVVERCGIIKRTFLTPNG
jgi:hypothetical protein